MSRTTRIAAVATLSVFALVAGACSLLIDDYPLSIAEDASAPDAGADATKADGSSPSATCTNVRPPPRPMSPNMALGDTYLVAVRAFTLPSVPLGGFDLDGICTCDSRDTSPRHGGAACKAPMGPGAPDSCDADGGIDNALGKQVARFSAQTFNDTLDRANQKILCGYGTVLLALNGYNGLADDPEVIVTTLSSPGHWDPHDAGDPDNGPFDSGIPALLLDAGPDAAPVNCGPWIHGVNPFPPRFDGTDLWTSPPGTTIPTAGRKLPGVPILNGYVSNYKLVVDLSRESDAGVSLILSSEIPLTFHSPVMMATIVPLDSQGAPTDAGPPSIASIRLENGIIAGRCRTHEMLSAFAPIPLGGGAPTCSDVQQWTVLYLGVCTGADLPDDPSTDLDGSSTACTALSTAFGFTASAATIGSDHEALGIADAAVCDAAMTYCR